MVKQREINVQVKTIPHPVKIVLFWFIITRTVLTAVGELSTRLLAITYHTRPTYAPPWQLLQVWRAHDTLNILSIAAHGYPRCLDCPQATTYAFYPLFPYLTRLLTTITGNLYLSGWLIANLSLIAAAVLLHKLTEKRFNQTTADAAVILCFTFPFSYFLSAIATEGLFFLLLVLTFYLADSQRWWHAGAAGFLMAATRPQGVVMAAPLLLLYLKQTGYSLSRVRWDVLSIAFVILGLGAVMLHNQSLSGNPLAELYTRVAFRGHSITNPIGYFWDSLSHYNISYVFNAAVGLTILVVSSISAKHIGFEWWLVVVLPLLLAASTGLSSVPALGRIISVSFPVYVLLARRFCTGNRRVYVLVTFSLVQGFLMAFWNKSFFLTT